MSRAALFSGLFVMMAYPPLKNVGGAAGNLLYILIELPPAILVTEFYWTAPDPMSIVKLYQSSVLEGKYTFLSVALS